MKIRPLDFSLLLGLAAGVFFSYSSVPASGQSQQAQKVTPYKAIRVPSKYSGPPPKAEFAENSTETPAEQIRRRSRESRRKNFFPLITDPGRLADGQQETTALMIENIVYVENSDPSYPASLASAVIVGTVISGKGFVSEDRTYVYSDFQIRVDEILKQDPAANLVVGGKLIASRPGATVNFPSGHISHYLIQGRGHPKITKQYLLFLWKRVPDLPEYEVLYGGAYELSDGRAYPLDDEDNHYSAPEDENATLLLAKVKKGINASPK